jgi:hypothetical protein
MVEMSGNTIVDKNNKAGILVVLVSSVIKRCPAIHTSFKQGEPLL